MAADLPKRILEALKASEWWTRKTRDNGRTISPLKCPECGFSNAWAYSAAPWAVVCNRQNHCGAVIKARDLFPDLFISIEKDYPPTKTNPHRPATVYLHTRGIRQALEGLRYEFWPDVRKTGSGAVMFPVESDRKVYNGRLISPPPGEGKTHNRGSTAGLFWKHPGLSYDPAAETFITEGIVDALSLIEMGFQAIAVLSSGQDPGNMDLSHFGKLVFAFDNDAAGQRALKKWIAHYPDAGAVMSPAGRDWNDLLSSGGQTAGKTFEQNRSEYEFQARLALCKTPKEYAETYYQYMKIPPGLFVFDGSYHYATVKMIAREETVVAARQSNFTLEVDHFQLNSTIQDKPEYQYHLTVKPKSGRPIGFVASAEDLSQPGQMTKLFMSRSKSWWQGERKPSMQLARIISEATAPTVRTIQTIGHDAESNCYVFRDYMITPSGETVLPNEKGFFGVSRRKYVRPPSNGVVERMIKPGRGKRAVTDLYEMLVSTWGFRAAVGFAWMLGSWFVHDIAYHLGFYPFLSFHGDTHTGKSSLIYFLQMMQGIDGEGLPMTKVNTSKGKIRELAQRASLFHALLEANAGESSRFDFDQFLTLYNFGTLQTRAKKTTGLEVETIPFRSALIFGQNFEAFSSQAMRERVISVHFPADKIITAESKAVYDKLKTVPRPEFPMVLPAVMKHRQALEGKWRDYWDKARRLLSGYGNTRVEENHAFVLAFHWLFTETFQVKYDLSPYIQDLTREKVKEVEHQPAGLADFFFDVVFDLVVAKGDTAKRVIDWPGLKNNGASLTPPPSGKLALNLNGVMDLYGQFRATVKDIQTALREHPAYLDSNKGYRFWKESFEVVHPKKAWIFDLSKISRAGEDSARPDYQDDDRPFG
ncbi:hypothetical protein HNR65_002243 [Desulfosalsimonas propionicica]|uniref:Toprim domain-containing protein n=1 Tax=Desulfosalsimonas propionicica TaxID=332175 RepID=A0A7W0C9Z7_9BACT|nr:toprim domain-containing protein [Desulfosalsimonas propionicica]MBA2881909.1 hypothetical protein [Desulfosalsimonas propionicica]